MTDIPADSVSTDAELIEIDGITYIKTPLLVALDRIKAVMSGALDNMAKIRAFVSRYDSIYSFDAVRLAESFFFMGQSGLGVDESVVLMPGFLKWAIETTPARVQEYLDTSEGQNDGR
jgi:hypothetical protein